MKGIILLAVFALFFMVSTSNAKRLYYDNDNDMELTDQKARMFLRAMEDDDSNDADNALSLDTRWAPGCVGCKFGIFPCCAPNFCRKKFLRPNECVEIKTGK